VGVHIWYASAEMTSAASIGIGGKNKRAIKMMTLKRGLPALIYLMKKNT